MSVSFRQTLRTIDHALPLAVSAGDHDHPSVLGIVGRQVQDSPSRMFNHAFFSDHLRAYAVDSNVGNNGADKERDLVKKQLVLVAIKDHHPEDRCLVIDTLLEPELPESEVVFRILMSFGPHVIEGRVICEQ